MDYSIALLRKQREKLERKWEDHQKAFEVVQAGAVFVGNQGEGNGETDLGTLKLDFGNSNNKRTKERIKTFHHSQKVSQAKRRGQRMKPNKTKTFGRQCVKWFKANGKDLGPE